MANAITIETNIKADISKVWQFWTEPEHICQWLFASDDWECPKAENDVRVGGKFSSTMRAKDLSVSFDFSGTYTQVEPQALLEYTMPDSRKVRIVFTSHEGTTTVVETFDMETMNSEERQRSGWQAILDNFKKHVESSV